MVMGSVNSAHAIAAAGTLAAHVLLLALALLQLQEIKKNEDPRLSFCTPEFKEAQRTFTDAFKVCLFPGCGWRHGELATS